MAWRLLAENAMRATLGRRILGLGLFLLAAFGLLAVVLRRHSNVSLTEGSARGPDPLAVVASDLAAAREDLGALGTQFGEKLQSLYEELERSALERDAELRRTIARVEEDLEAHSSTLESKLDANARQVAVLEAHVRALRERTPGVADTGELLQSPALDAPDPLDAGGGDSGDPVHPPSFIASSENEPETRIAASPTSHEQKADAGAEPTAERAAAAPAPKKSFLAFQLPSQSFAFEERQTFVLLPQLSRVGFDAESTLHDFSGVTSALEGELEACLARPGEGCSGRISVRAATLDTGLGERDETMREVLAVDSYPEIRFDWTGFAPEHIDAVRETLSGTALGRITIHGTTREISMPVEVAVDESKRVSIEGECRLKLGDFGVEAPSQLGLISMKDEITVWIALRARSLGVKKEGGTR